MNITLLMEKQHGCPLDEFHAAHRNGTPPLCIPCSWLCHDNRDNYKQIVCKDICPDYNGQYVNSVLVALTTTCCLLLIFLTISLSHNFSKRGSKMRRHNKYPCSNSSHRTLSHNVEMCHLQISENTSRQSSSYLTVPNLYEFKKSVNKIPGGWGLPHDELSISYCNSGHQFKSIPPAYDSVSNQIELDNLQRRDLLPKEWLSEIHCCPIDEASLLLEVVHETDTVHSSSNLERNCYGSYDEQQSSDIKEHPINDASTKMRCEVRDTMNDVNVFELIRQNTTGRVPSYVFGIQFFKYDNSAYVYVDQSHEEEGRQFVHEHLDQYKHLLDINVICTDPPENLHYICTDCNSEKCCTIKGHDYHVFQTMDWIGPGTRIFAVKSIIWHQIQHLVNKSIRTLADVQIECSKRLETSPETKLATEPSSFEADSIGENLANPDYSIPSWSLGFALDEAFPEGKQTVFISTAHSLAENDTYDSRMQMDQFDSQIQTDQFDTNAQTNHYGSHRFSSMVTNSRNRNFVFVAEVTRGGVPCLVVISTEHWGIYKKEGECDSLCTDLLIMFPTQEALDLYKPKFVSGCSNDLKEFNINIFTGNCRDLNRQKVTKCGYASGATYGEITEQHLFLTQNSQFQYQNVFGVFSRMKQKSRFADYGDSGSVVIQRGPDNDALAYGLVWRIMKLVSIQTKKLEECVLCVMLNSCINKVVSEMTRPLKKNKNVNTKSIAMEKKSYLKEDVDSAYGASSSSACIQYDRHREHIAIERFKHSGRNSAIDADCRSPHQELSSDDDDVPEGYAPLPPIGRNRQSYNDVTQQDVYSNNKITDHVQRMDISITKWGTTDSLDVDSCMVTMHNSSRASIRTPSGAAANDNCSCAHVPESHETCPLLNESAEENITTTNSIIIEDLTGEGEHF